MATLQELAQYDPKHGIVTHHTVTPYYCRTDAHGRAYLSAGVALALFDEISTCAAMVQDRAHRPGVSVSLEAHMLQHVREFSIHPSQTGRQPGGRESGGG